VLAVYWNDGQNNLGLGTTLIEPDRWYHFAMVYDGDIRWYLDGRLEGSVIEPDVVDPGTASIGIGNNRTGLEVGRRAFRGLLDEIRIVDEALEPGMFLIGSARPVLRAGDADMDGAGRAGRSSRTGNRAAAGGQPCGLVARDAAPKGYPLKGLRVSCRGPAEGRGVTFRDRDLLGAGGRAWSHVRRP
jgi:hypothetical protein